MGALTPEAAGAMEKTLQTPRAAGAAGIVFAVLLAATIILVHSAIPIRPVNAATWLASSSSRDAARATLALLPFAGIIFLWFMGAVRSYVGEGEDKFFATIFLGSGLLFVAALFTLAAETGSMLATAAVPRGTAQLHLWQYGRNAAFTLLSSYCMRMAAVFTIATSTIGRRLGVFPCWLTWLGYLVAIILLFVVTSIAWFQLAFPLWALVVSGYMLTTSHSAAGA
ncbi:hypothetical protein NGB36_21680 [Streptomyces sp. RB6PN25]|uniref:DUF4386 domain-containing protein n=1 Tax=Streptomyces humicola TaxID=2953240 RepID=A0ABT1PZN2_9ACTN|nr:hypothetical protein [Streptomyces humicola]MCQ4083145.1 hypothetical protein [Streptomyces humicola]